MPSAKGTMLVNICCTVARTASAPCIFCTLIRAVVSGSCEMTSSRALHERHYLELCDHIAVNSIPLQASFAGLLVHFTCEPTAAQVHSR